MNPIDFIIIYLACGAPFGVYFYLQHRLANEFSFLWLKTFAAFIFWIPLALFIVCQSKPFKTLANNSFNKPVFEKIKTSDNLYSIQKTIEEIFLMSEPEISLFELRQIIERYVGLTLPLENNQTKAAEQEMEIFRIAETKSVAISALCLKRRNRKRLAFHQSRARQDFLQVVGNLFDSTSKINELEVATTTFVNLLDDSAARETLEKLFAKNLQTRRRQSVKLSEKVLWKTEIPKLSPAKPISTRLQIAATAATNSHGKD